MADLTELYKKQRAVTQEINDALKAAKESGEVIVIDGKEYDSTMDFEGELPEPKDTDYFPTYRKDDNGDITDSGEITYKALIEKFGAAATEILNQAIEAGETSVTNIQEALTAALAAIGQDNASGARGQAIAAINALYSTIAEAITSANSAWNSQVSTDKSAWASQVSADLQSLSTALSNALAAIGESNSAGARGAAIEAVNEALQNALASIGTSDTTGARGEAITAIENALNTALTTWASQVSEDNTAFDNKVAQANTTIDQKVTTATTKATEASNSAALAKKWAENPEDEPVEGTGDDAEYSSKHWAKKAEANSQVPMATDTTAGKVYLSDTVEIGENEANLANKVVNKQALHDALEDLRNDMKQTLPSPEVEYVKAATGDYGTFTLKTNYSSAFGSVKVVMTPSSADPSASDTEITVGGTMVTANDNWQITAIQTDPNAMYSDSLTAVIEVTDLKVQTPVINYDDDTYTITLQCATVGAVIHYTIDGSSVSASSPVYSGAISIDESVTIQVLAVKTGIQNSNTVSQVCNVAQIIAVRRPITMTGTAWTRLTPSTDPLGIVTETINTEPTGEITGTRTGQSVFDNYGPWKLRMRNYNDDGTPGVWEDEAGFTLTDKDVMVYFPKCHIKLVVDASYITKYISTKPYDGFAEAPWSEEYLARYETSNNNQSRSGKTVQVNQSIVTMRTNARAKGAGWQLNDLPTWHAMQWLFVVEYADYDCQTLIGKGISSTSAAHQTGETDAMEFHTGRVAGTDGNTAVQYRHIENPWGNVWEWLDGYNEISRVPYVSTDRDNYQSDVTTGYTKIYDGWSSNIYGQGIKSTIINDDMPWCDGIPKEKGGSDTTYIPDYMDVGNSGNHVACVSGYWNHGSRCGLWYFNATYYSSFTYSRIGSRLSYKEPSAA